MPFEKQELIINKHIKITKFLINQLNINQKEAQKLIDKGNVYVNGNLLKQKGEYVTGKIEIIKFIPKDINIKPIFKTLDFAIFDKPPKLLVHPKGKYNHKSLLDSIKYYCNLDSNLINRIDNETSGIILASLNKKSEIKLKMMFQNQEIKKTYLAYVNGKCKSQIINLNILKQDKKKDLGIRMIVDPNGKKAITEVKAISYNKKNNLTLIKIHPITGRTHQIRVHLAHIGHNILGENLYGINDNLARDFLDGKINDDKRKQYFGANRLMLHSYKLEFNFQNNAYILKSKKRISI